MCREFQGRHMSDMVVQIRRTKDIRFISKALCLTNTIEIKGFVP